MPEFSNRQTVRTVLVIQTKHGFVHHWRRLIHKPCTVMIWGGREGAVFYIDVKPSHKSRHVVKHLRHYKCFLFQVLGKMLNQPRLHGAVVSLPTLCRRKSRSVQLLHHRAGSTLETLGSLSSSRFPQSFYSFLSEYEANNSPLASGKLESQTSQGTSKSLQPFMQRMVRAGTWLRHVETVAAGIWTSIIASCK